MPRVTVEPQAEDAVQEVVESMIQVESPDDAKRWLSERGGSCLNCQVVGADDSWCVPASAVPHITTPF